MGKSKDFSEFKDYLYNSGILEGHSAEVRSELKNDPSINEDNFHFAYSNEMIVRLLHEYHSWLHK